MRIRTHHDFPPTPIRSFDWSAWFEGREEWLIGRGSTEGEAVADLLEQVWESGEEAA